MKILTYEKKELNRTTKRFIFYLIMTDGVIDNEIHHSYFYKDNCMDRWNFRITEEARGRHAFNEAYSYLLDRIHAQVSFSKKIIENNLYKNKDFWVFGYCFPKDLVGLPYFFENTTRKFKTLKEANKYRLAALSVFLKQEGFFKDRITFDLEEIDITKKNRPYKIIKKITRNQIELEMENINFSVTETKDKKIKMIKKVEELVFDGKYSEEYLIDFSKFIEL